MNGPILVGYDGSDESRDALALAKGLARISRSPLMLAWIEPVGPLDVPYETIFEPIQLRAEEALREVARGLHEQEFEVSTRVGLLGSAAHGIHELAEEESAALVVVGSSHRGRVGRVLAGTVGTRLLHGSPCPVAVAPRGLADAGEWRPAVIGVAYDGSPEAHAALEHARYLARTARATLKVIAVAELMARLRKQSIRRCSGRRRGSRRMSGSVKPVTRFMRNSPSSRRWPRVSPGPSC